MSRIGKNPVPVPEKVTVSLDGLTVKVKGPKGELERTLPEGVSVSQDNNTIVVSPTSTKRISRERHGHGAHGRCAWCSWGRPRWCCCPG